MQNNNFSEATQTGGGSRSTSDMYLNSEPHWDCHEILTSAHGDSFQYNFAKTHTVLSTYAQAKQQPDLEMVTANGSLLILNLLAGCCNFRTPQSLSNDFTGAFIQGLRYVYIESEIIGVCWIYSNGNATEIPL